MTTFAFGAFGTNNVGDEAIFAGLRRTLGSIRQIYVNHSSCPDAVFYADLLEGKVKFEVGDHLIIGGGGILHSHGAIRDYARMADLMQRAKGTVEVRAVGAEAFPNDAAEALRALLTAADSISVRSTKSRQILAKYTDKPIQVERDLAFALADAELPSAWLPEIPVDRVIGLVTGGQTSFDDYRQLRALIRRITVGPDAMAVVHIPHSCSYVDSANNDELTGHYLWSGIDIYHASRLAHFRTLPFNCDPLAALALYRQLDGVITYRYHGLIFSELADVPALLAACGPKNMSYVEDSGRANLFLADLGTNDDACRASIDAFLSQVRGSTGGTAKRTQKVIVKAEGSQAPTPRSPRPAFDPDWVPTGESSKSYKQRIASGFFTRYLSGPVVLDIGYKGYGTESRPVLRTAIGVDNGYPGYNGKRLPFEDGTVDAVYSSHLLEHVPDPLETIRDWYRVLKVGGFIVTIVPHQHLYEKKLEPPSRFNGDHKRFYTPGRLIAEFEAALVPNSFRLRHLMDNDRGHDYSLPPEKHSNWCYEIELVVEKISKVPWELA